MHTEPGALRTYPYVAFIVQPSLGLKKLTIERAYSSTTDIDDKGRLHQVVDLHTDPKDAVAEAQRRLAVFEADLQARQATHAKRAAALAKIETAHGVAPRSKVGP